METKNREAYGTVAFMSVREEPNVMRLYGGQEHLQRDHVVFIASSSAIIGCCADMINGHVADYGAPPRWRRCAEIADILNNVGAFAHAERPESHHSNGSQEVIPLSFPLWDR